ncbi:hypothetical protein R20233_03913 [Ralstonia sp. LMG 32965]|nr:hypothetical protein R20233_03913 [Ralstonia sp. LMG 32965]
MTNAAPPPPPPPLEAGPDVPAPPFPPAPPCTVTPLLTVTLMPVEYTPAPPPPAPAAKLNPSNAWPDPPCAFALTTASPASTTAGEPPAPPCPLSFVAPVPPVPPEVGPPGTWTVAEPPPSVEEPPPPPLPLPPLPLRSGMPAPPAALQFAIVLDEQVAAQPGSAAPASPSDTLIEMMEARRRACVVSPLASTPPCDALVSSDTTCGARKVRLQTSR